MENQNINQIQNNQIQAPNIEKKENDFRNIMLSIVGVFVILAAVSGGTYAYYAYSATNSTTIAGTAATANLTLEVIKVTPETATGPMVPQLSANTTTQTNPLKTAIEAGCVDGNSNIVCHVYKIAVQNAGTATIKINGTLTLTADTMTNLKWYTLASGTGTTVPTTATYTYPTNFTAKYGNLKAVTALDTEVTLATNYYQYYFVVIWIEETGESQNATDKGSFTGTVAFTDSTGNGLTSTFAG